MLDGFGWWLVLWCAFVIVAMIWGLVKGQKWPFGAMGLIILYGAFYWWFWNKIEHLPEDMMRDFAKRHAHAGRDR